MTRLLPVLLVTGLILTGCKKSDAPAETPTTTAGLAAGVSPISSGTPVAAEPVDSVSLLRHQNRVLLQEIDARDDFIQNYVTLVQEAVTRLNNMASETGSIRTMTSGLLQNELAGRRAEKGEVTALREQINQRLTDLEQHIRQEKQRNLTREADRARSALRQRQSTTRAGAQIETLGKELTVVERTARELSAMLEQREREIASLRQEVQTQFAAIERLRRENEGLRATNQGLSTAYLAVGTTADLADRGLITRKGFMPTRPRYEELSTRTNAFTRIDIGMTTIQISDQPLRRAKILTDQKHNSRLFRFDRDNRRLTILDPEAFWKSGRHLIVEIER